MKQYLFIITYIFSITAQTQTPDWECLPIPSPSDIVLDLNVYNGNLIVSGLFKKLDTFTTNSIIKWNGTNWSFLKNGLRRKDKFAAIVAKTFTYNYELYVIGDFDSAGSIAASDIAKWDGNKWTGLGTGSNGRIGCITVYNNEIFVGGEFDSIGGIASKNMAKWDGNKWSAVGKGLIGYSTNSLYVYKNELYALGAIDSADGIACNSIARWNGANWNIVSDKIKNGNCMIEWNNKLLIAAQNKVVNSIIYRQIMQWDGTNCDIFSEQKLFTIADIKVFNGDLYCSGGYTSPGYASNVAVFNKITLQWDKVGKGLNNGVVSLCVYNKELYAAGAFNKKDSGKCDFIAKLNMSASSEKIILDDQIIATVNTNEDKILINSNLTNASIRIYNLEGKLLISEMLTANQSSIDNFYYTGLFIWQISNLNGSHEVRTGKFAKY